MTMPPWRCLGFLCATQDLGLALTQTPRAGPGTHRSTDMCHQMWCGHPKSHLDHTGRMVWHSQWLCPPSHIRLVPILQLGELGGWCMMKKHQARWGLISLPSVP